MGGIGPVPARPYINNLVLSRVEKGARLGSRLHCPDWGHIPSQPQEPLSPVTLSSLKSLKQSELPAQLSLLGMTEGDGGTCMRPLCGQPHGGLGGGAGNGKYGTKAANRQLAGVKLSPPPPLRLQELEWPPSLSQKRGSSEGGDVWNWYPGGPCSCPVWPLPFAEPAGGSAGSSAPGLVPKLGGPSLHPKLPPGSTGPIMAGYEVRGVPKGRVGCRVQGRALNRLPHCTCCACLNSPCGSVYKALMASWSSQASLAPGILRTPRIACPWMQPSNDQVALT